MVEHCCWERRINHKEGYGKFGFKEKKHENKLKRKWNMKGPLKLII